MNAMVRWWGRPAVPIDFSRFGRMVAWFSAGAASSVACKLAIDQARGSGIEIVAAYIDTGSEHEDNSRFIEDCGRWFGVPVMALKNVKYTDTWEVFEKERWLNGIDGAKCTTVLKKQVREKFERVDDLQVFGFDMKEAARAERFAKDHPEVALWCPLIDEEIQKERCFTLLAEAGIRIPTMYLMGYTNNNCIGCVKGGAGYWNKIRRDFPEIFNRMARLERLLGARLCQATINGRRQRVFLDELPPDAGRYGREKMACGIVCDQGQWA